MRTVVIFFPVVLAAGCTLADEAPGSRAAQAGLSAERPDEGLSVERRGGRVPAAPMGLTRIGRQLWIGTRAVRDVTRPDEPLRGELVRLDLDRGDARIFEDELPRFTPDWDEEQPVWTAGAAAIGARTYLASYQGVVVVEGDRVRLVTVELGGGRQAHGNVIGADARRGHERVWLGTDEGVVALSPDGRVAAHLDPTALGGEHVVSLSVAPTGVVFAVVHGEDGATRVVRISGDRVVSAWSPPPGGGAVWSVVAAPKLGGALVAVRSFDAASGGVLLWRAGEAATTLVTEGRLAQAARGKPGAFGASVLAYDEPGDLVIVGGQLRPGGVTGGMVGGGLAWIDLSGAAPAVTGLSTGTSALRGDFVTALAWDPVRRRTYAALHQPCSEVKLATIGVETITFAGGAPRFERPIVSGVRDVSVEGDRVLLALRDGSPGDMCDGVAVGEGLARLAGDGSAWIDEARVSSEPSFNGNRIAPVVLAGEPGEGLIGAATPEWGLFLGVGAGLLVNPFGDFSISKTIHDLVFDGPKVFWLAGAASHSAFDTPESTERAQRGAVRVELDGRGGFASVRRYVMRVADREAGDLVPGLPSSDVRAVIPTGDGGAFLVCGLERMTDLPWEHLDAPPFEDRDGQRPGGVALVDARGGVTVLADGEVVPDGRAGALGPDGTLYVLDAVHGLLAWDGGRFVASPLPVEVPRGSVPTALWIGEGGDLAASFSTGLAVRLGGVSAFLDGFGHAWRAAERAPGVLYVGTDEGLLVVRAPGAEPIVERAPAAGEPPPFGR